MLKQIPINDVHFQGKCLSYCRGTEPLVAVRLKQVFLKVKFEIKNYVLYVVFDTQIKAEFNGQCWWFKL